MLFHFNSVDRPTISLSWRSHLLTSLIMPQPDRGHYKLSSLCLSVCLSVYCVPRHNSKNERPRKIKFGRMEADDTGNPWTYLEFKRSKVKIIRPTNAHRTNAQYIPNRKSYELGTQTQHEDPHQRQALWPPRSKVKVARSRDASDRCWPIRRKRNVIETPKLVGKLSTLQAIWGPTSTGRGCRGK